MKFTAQQKQIFVTLLCVGIPPQLYLYVYGQMPSLMMTIILALSAQLFIATAEEIVKAIIQKRSSK